LNLLYTFGKLPNIDNTVLNNPRGEVRETRITKTFEQNKNCIPSPVEARNRPNEERMLVNKLFYTMKLG
jgi:hypothetical protein